MGRRGYRLVKGATFQIAHVSFEGKKSSISAAISKTCGRLFTRYYKASMRVIRLIQFHYLI